MPGYKMYIGGRWGKKVAHGHVLSKVFTTEEELLDTVEKAILLFREQGKTGERFVVLSSNFAAFIGQEVST